MGGSTVIWMRLSTLRMYIDVTLSILLCQKQSNGSNCSYTIYIYLVFSTRICPKMNAKVISVNDIYQEVTWKGYYRKFKGSF